MSFPQEVLSFKSAFIVLYSHTSLFLPSTIFISIGNYSFISVISGLLSFSPTRLKAPWDWEPCLVSCTVSYMNLSWAPSATELGSFSPMFLLLFGRSVLSDSLQPHRLQHESLIHPVLHHLPEPAQIHVHGVGDAIQPSHPLLSPSPPAFNLSQHQGLF